MYLLNLLFKYGDLQCLLKLYAIASDKQQNDIVLYLRQKWNVHEIIHINNIKKPFVLKDNQGNVIQGIYYPQYVIVKYIKVCNIRTWNNLKDKIGYNVVDYCYLPCIIIKYINIYCEICEMTVALSSEKMSMFYGGVIYNIL